MVDQVKMISLGVEHSLKMSRREESEENGISFSDKNLIKIYNLHDDAVVIFIIIAKYDI